jgi:site-specific recombinase XerD
LRTYGPRLAGLAEFFEASGVTDWADVDAMDLRRYVASLQASDSRRGPSTIRVYATIISCFFNWLDEQGLVPINPMQRVRRPRSPKRPVDVFTDEELAALFAAAETSREPRRNKVMLYLLLDCGLRAAELLAVKPGDYDPATFTLTVRGKGRRIRQVKLGRRCREAFEQYLPTRNGDMWGLGITRLGYMIRDLGKRAGVPGVHPHKFRHSFAVRFLDAGGTIDELQYLMGHESITTTMIYSRAGREQRALRSHALHSPLDGLPCGLRASAGARIGD